MSPDLIGIILGIALVVPTLYVVRSQGVDAWAWSAILATLPLYYMLMGLLAEDTSVIWLELLYGLPYVITALIVRTQTSRWALIALALAWLSHGLYDYYHDVFFVNPGVFTWYPAFCALIDVVVGLYLLARVRSLGATGASNA